MITHSTSENDACKDRAMDGSETETIFASRLIMNEGTDTQSRMTKTDTRSLGTPFNSCIGKFHNGLPILEIEPFYQTVNENSFLILRGCAGGNLR